MPIRTTASSSFGLTNPNQTASRATIRTITIGEIIISSRAHKNVGGRPYASSVNYTHSSDLRTLQNIFHVGPYLGDAANATDLSDLFDVGAVPKKP